MINIVLPVTFLPLNFDFALKVTRVANQSDSRAESLCRQGQGCTLLSTLFTAQNVTEWDRRLHQAKQWVTHPSTNRELCCLTS